MTRYCVKVAVPGIMSIRHSTVFELEEENKTVKSVFLRMQLRKTSITDCISSFRLGEAEAHFSAGWWR